MRRRAGPRHPGCRPWPRRPLGARPGWRSRCLGGGGRRRDGRGSVRRHDRRQRHGRLGQRRPGLPPTGMRVGAASGKAVGEGSRAVAGGSGGGAAEVLAGCAYRGVVRAKHGGPGGGHAAVVAAGLVPVAQLRRHLREVEAEGEHQRVGVPAAALTGRVRLFEHPPGGGRVVGLPMQPGQQMAGGQDVRVVLAVGRGHRGQRVGEQAAGAGQVARGAERQGPVLSGGQRGGVGHGCHAARNRRLRATRPMSEGAELRKQGGSMVMCMIVPGRVQ